LKFIILILSTLFSLNLFAFNCEQVSKVQNEILNFNSIETNDDSTQRRPHLYYDKNLYYNTSFTMNSYQYMILTELDPQNLILMRQDLDTFYFKANTGLRRQDQFPFFNSKICSTLYPFIKTYQKRVLESISILQSKKEKILNIEHINNFFSGNKMDSAESRINKWRSYLMTFNSMEEGYEKLMEYFLRHIKYDLYELSARTKLTAFMKVLDPYSQAFFDKSPFETYYVNSDNQWEKINDSITYVNIKNTSTLLSEFEKRRHSLNHQIIKSKYVLI